MKQEKKGKEKIRGTRSRREIMIKNIQEEEMRDKNKIEDERRSIKNWNSEEKNIREGIIMKRTVSSRMKVQEN